MVWLYLWYCYSNDGYFLFSFLPIEQLASELGASFRMCGPFIKSSFFFPGNLYLCVWFYILLLFCWWCCYCCFYLSLIQNEVVKSETHSSNQSTHLLNRCFSIGNFSIFFRLLFRFVSFLIRQIFILQLPYASFFLNPPVFLCSFRTRLNTWLNVYYTGLNALSATWTTEY